MFHTTKTWGHDLGLSCCFRQWRAQSHCRHMHGYALSIRIDFESEHLDERGWVLDFGSLQPIKAQLAATFDHKTVIAADDPERAWFEHAQQLGLVDLVVLPGVGC